MSEQNHYIYEFGPFRLDARKRLLLREGEIVPLKPKAFDTLLALVEGCGRVVGKDELMGRVWPDTAVEEGNLTFNISGLRKALGDDPRRHEYIVTIPGEGYRFVAGVRATFDELEVRESTSVTVEVEEEPGSPNEAGGGGAARALDGAHGERESEAAAAARRLSAASVAASREGRGRVVMMAVAALLVVGSAAAFGFYRLARQRQTGNRAAVAVPFRELSITRLTTSGRVTRAAISPDGRYVAHATRDAESDSLWVRHVAAPAGVRLAGPASTEYAWVAFAPDGDSVYYLTLDRDKGDSVLYRVPVLGGPSSMVAYDTGPVGFSPDRRQLAFMQAYADDESLLVVTDADGRYERTLAALRLPDHFRVIWNAPAWSPDGRTIACPVRLTDELGHYETIVGVSVADGSQTPLTSRRWSYAGQPAWLADGSGLLFTASETETDPAQVWHVALAGGEAMRVTRDLNNYDGLSLTADGGRLAAVQIHTVSSVWVAPEGDAGRARQVASEVGRVREVAWTPDGRLVYRSQAGGTADIWVMNADGSDPRQLTAGARVSRGLAVSPDGRYIYFASDRAGHSNIWRADADGGNLKQMTFGDGETYPHCTPDGRWVVYQRGEIEPSLWKVGADGGEPVRLTETRAVRPAVSPDGGMVAYHYLDPDLERSRWSIGVVSSDGGPRLKRFDFPPTVTPAHRFVRWSPDGRSIAYADSRGGLSDVWAQPLDGSPPRRLTDVKAEQIFAFDWSRDGRSLVLIRGVETSDVILIGDSASN